jgi:hypothetical protein
MNRVILSSVAGYVGVRADPSNEDRRRETIPTRTRTRTRDEGYLV